MAVTSWANTTASPANFESQLSENHLYPDDMGENVATLDFAALDFAIDCARGRIDVETDGDTWHPNPERAALDNRRDNALKMVGWSVLRFNTTQVCEQMTEYCIPTIAKTINHLGGLDENGVMPRRIELPDESGRHQKCLFDDV